MRTIDARHLLNDKPLRVESNNNSAFSAITLVPSPELVRQTMLACAVLFAQLLVTTPASAEPSLGDYGNLPSTAMMAVSPSGNAIAFRRTEDGVDRLVVYSLQQKEVLRAVDISEILPNRMYFVSDHQLILVASELRKITGYRGEFAVSSAFVFDVKSGKIEQLLTPGDKIYRGQGGLGRIVGISADKQYLYMPALVQKEGTQNIPRLTLMKVEIESPNRPRIMKKGRSNTIDYFSSANGELLAIETYSEGSDKHRVLAKHDGDWVAIFEDVVPIRRFIFDGVTPDQSALVMLETDQQTGRTSYSTMSLSDGSITRNLMSRDDADVESVLKDINRVAHGVIYSGFNPSYEFFDADVDQRMKEIQAIFPNQSVWLRDWSEDWKHWVVYVEGDIYAGIFYLFSEGEKTRQLASARPNIKSEDINTIISTTIEARDGFSIPTLLTVPNDRIDSLADLPAVMLPHGGPQSYDRIEFDWLAQAIASQGYLVIQPQFRGSDGFGAAHIAAGYGEWGRKMQDDLIDTLEYLVQEKIVDASRVCTVGWSYGGYAALAAAAFTPDLYQCVISINGVSDLPGMLAWERNRLGKDHWVVSYFENFMVEGEATKDKLNEVSPVRFADQFTAPVLLIHGENDETVPFEQSNDMYKRLVSANKDVELIKQKDENHSMTTSENRLEALEVIVTFINEHIGDDAVADR